MSTMVENGKVSEPVNLTGSLTTSLVGSVADFPVGRSLVTFKKEDGSVQEWPERNVIYRADNCKELAVVSDRYSLVSNNQCFELIESAIQGAGIQDVRAGVAILSGGRKFRALYILPESTYEIGPNDVLCCTILVTGSYDGSTRLIMEVGAYRFACTNLMTGGGGILGGGFRVLHKGNLEKEIEQVTPMVEEILTTFPERAARLAEWNEIPWGHDAYGFVMSTLEDDHPGMKRHAKILGERWDGKPEDSNSLWWAYNEGTNYSTHETKSVGVAYRVGDAINRSFLSYYGALAPADNLN